MEGYSSYAQFTIYLALMGMSTLQKCIFSCDLSENYTRIPKNAITELHMMNIGIPGKKSIRILILKRYFLMLFLTAGICCFFSAPAAAQIGCGSGVIVIDAGHGGVDGGAGAGELLEKDINLKLALKVRTLLELKGFTVVMTRDADVSLDKLNHSSSSRHKRDLNARVDIINASRAQIFISLHVNNFPGDPTARGSLVFYSKELRPSRLLAFYIQEALNKLTAGGEARKQNAPLPGRYYLLGCADVPGVIVETAYLSNPKERDLLKSEEYLDLLARAIAGGAASFLESE
jgi:N-acetylmuramoyl-L-alanine amidase